MTETELLNTIVREAKANGWRVFHQLPAMRSTGRGWHSATQGHTGFPDLVLAHGARGRLIFAELKSEEAPKKLPTEQQAWIDTLDAVAEASEQQPEVYVWRPSSLPSIISILYGRALAR